MNRLIKVNECVRRQCFVADFRFETLIDETLEASVPVEELFVGAGDL